MDDPRRPDEGGPIPPDSADEAPGTSQGASPGAERESGRASSFPPAPELAIEGPLTREAARAILDRAAEMMAAGDFQDAGVHYRRVIGFDDPNVTAAALLGLGQALYRLDADDAAIATWESILELPETPSTYRAWRELAAARVRDGDLSGAIKAYREAERRAPADERPEIANRLGWLAKETGNTGAARRYFARGRGAGPALPLPWIVIGVTIVTSFMAISADGGEVLEALWLDKRGVAQGELWRLWTVTLVHSPTSLLHLLFNMYALFLAGPLVERLYGSRLFLLFYLLCAAAGSIGSLLFGPSQFAVGASGAVFGLFGILLVASRSHHPALDRQGRAFLGQIGTLIMINLIFGFLVPSIDNAAHIGGLLAGLWLGFIFTPGKVPTLRSMWQQTGSDGRPPVARSALGVAALAAVLAIGVAVGSANWQGRGRADVDGAPAAPIAAAVARARVRGLHPEA